MSSLGLRVRDFSFWFGWAGVFREPNTPELTHIPFMLLGSMMQFFLGLPRPALGLQAYGSGIAEE